MFNRFSKHKLHDIETSWFNRPISSWNAKVNKLVGKTPLGVG